LCLERRWEEEGVVLCKAVGQQDEHFVVQAVVSFAVWRCGSALGELAEAQVCPHFVLLRDLCKRKNKVRRSTTAQELEPTIAARPDQEEVHALCSSVSGSTCISSGSIRTA
jgi:hypothetical protein